MNITRPRPRAAMPGSSSLVRCIVAVRFTVTSSSTFAAGISSSAPDQPRPALLIRMSIPPCALPDRVAGPARGAGPLATGKSGHGTAAGAEAGKAGTGAPPWGRAEADSGAEARRAGEADCATEARRAGEADSAPPRSAADALRAAAASAAGPPGAARSASRATPPVSAARSLSRVPSRPAISSLVPAAAISRAIAAPIPEDPPVTSTTAPESRMVPHFNLRIDPLCSGGGRGVLPLRGYAHLRPAPHDVPHREQAGDMLPLDDDEMAEPPAHHGGGGLLQCPLRCREHEVAGAVMIRELGIRVLARAERVQDVALGQDAHPRVLRVDHDGGTDVARRHHAGGFAQRMRGPDGQDQLGHAVAYFHDQNTPGMA